VASAPEVERPTASVGDQLTKTLSVYGLRAEITGDWPEVIDDIAKDFAWFAETEPSAGTVHARVTVERRPPDFDRFARLDSAFVTPRNVVYQDKGTTVVDYFGHALSILDRRQGNVTIQGEHPGLVHEAAYNFLLSRIGEHLDARGLVRLHALGLSGPLGAVAVMLPSGGGKTTLALRALQDPSCRLLSEDSPLIDRHGLVHPFPLRIGVNPGDAASLPQANVRLLDRLEFHPKLALDLEAFKDRVEPSAQPLRHLVIGRRTLGRKARLEPATRRGAIGPLLTEAVIGLGIYQGMEFVLQRGMLDVLGKLGTLAMRSACARSALSHARVWRLELGRDPDDNWEHVRQLLET
jgi:hypothetical protein